jgi:hypothetical protein
MAKSAKMIRAELYPKIYFEDATLNRGETFKSLLLMYGHRNNVKVHDNIWKTRFNANLRLKYKTPKEIQPGDKVFVPIPPISHYRFNFGTVKSKDPIGKKSWPSHGWVEIQVDRYGNTNESDFSQPLGTTAKSRLRWVQTVYQGNQPMDGTPANCVDPCPANDEDPFFYVTKDYKPFETTDNGTEMPRPFCGSEGIYEDCYKGHASFAFRDRPRRKWPAKSMGVTKWRAVLSLVAVTNRRVTLVWTGKWGFDISPEGQITPLELSKVSETELAAHLRLLRNGQGKDQHKSFSKQGWEFRQANPKQFMSP